jgi:hypothetical protein
MDKITFDFRSTKKKLLALEKLRQVSFILLKQTMDKETSIKVDKGGFDGLVY